MTDLAQATPREEQEVLLNVVLPFAQQLLSKNGEYFSFAAVIDIDGKPRVVAGDVGEERPESSRVIDFLTQALRSQAASGAIRASAICYDIRWKPESGSELTDAICVDVEHVGDAPWRAVLPYKVKGGLLGRKITYGELEGQAAEPKVFLK